MKGQKPRISVLMPVRNGAKTLTRAIASLTYQTEPNWELILVDDGSTDGTSIAATASRDPRIRFFADGVMKGRGFRLNQAVSYAKGDYIARLDADDVAVRNRLELQADYLDCHPKVDLVASRVLAITPDGQILGSYQQHCDILDHEQISAHPWRGFPMAHPSWLGRASWFRSHPYSNAPWVYEDQELLLRTFRNCRFACLGDVLLVYNEDRNLYKMLLARFGQGIPFARYWLLRGHLHYSVLAITATAGRIAMDVGRHYFRLQNCRNTLHNVEPPHSDTISEAINLFRAGCHAPASPSTTPDT